MVDAKIEQEYALAKERYGALGVNTDEALERLRGCPFRCTAGKATTLPASRTQTPKWAADWPLQATIPAEPARPTSCGPTMTRPSRSCRARTASTCTRYTPKPEAGEFDRDQLAPEHFAKWIDWAKAKGLAIDFNPTCFRHPKAADGLTLAHPDNEIRQFWIDHCIACRKIGAAFGKALGKVCVTNVWIPDGYKDVTIDRKTPRERLARSLDEVFAAPLDPAQNLDAVEPKLFGIGSETFVVGSMEFYYGYAISRKKLLCLDMGHFHPTESVADKISTVMLYIDRLLLHVSRGIRWDSDHVVILNDELCGG